MLSVMCPNCRHRFPAPGCCGGQAPAGGPTADPAPMLVDPPTNAQDHCAQQVTISTKCGIQSGGCMIQSSSAEVLLRASGSSSQPLLELRSSLSGGGGCLVQKTIDYHPSLDSTKDINGSLFINAEQLRSNYERADEFHRSHSTTARLDPAQTGCDDLPGSQSAANPSECCNCCCCYAYCRSSRSCCGLNKPEPLRRCNHPCQLQSAHCHRHQSRCNNCDQSKTDGSKYSGEVEIQVNATVRLPSTISSSVSSSCTLSITASTSQPPNNTITSRARNNLNGGGIVSGLDNCSSREEAPSTPVSWLAPCPWGFDTAYLPERDVTRLAEVRRALQTCGWYHEGLSWKQCENLLKNEPVGRWFMRDSSVSRYTFAISVQTSRGPTSVRVFYFMGKFRLDAEPRLALAMPLFDCPFKMLEYYREYSKQDASKQQSKQQEVLVDYSGQVYSQIYLAEPLLKEVRSLSHLARIVVNRNGVELRKQIQRLPPLIKSYLDEYPYTL